MFYSAAENSAERWEAQTEKIRDGGSQEYKLKNPDLKKSVFPERGSTMISDIVQLKLHSLHFLFSFLTSEWVAR